VCGLSPWYLQISTSQDCHNPKIWRKMSFEIERKFLIRNDSWRSSATRYTKIRQAYLDSNAKVSIRVRIKDDGSATLTLKSRSSKLRRREFEYAIPTSDAEELLSLRRGHIVEKVRYIVPCGNLNGDIMITWGLVSGAMAFASGPASFLTLRFLLGVLKSTYFLVKILVWLRPKSNCSMKITRLNCRHGLAQKLLARIDTTTAPLRNIHTVRGFARMQRWLPNNANGTTSIDVSLPPREVGFGLQRRNSITKKYPRVHFGLGAVTPLQINCRSSAMPV